MSVFKKAERKQAKLRLGLTGPSGSGKTYAALVLARNIGKKVAVIDTENVSGSRLDSPSCNFAEYQSINDVEDDAMVATAPETTASPSPVLSASNLDDCNSRRPNFLPSYQQCARRI